MTTGITSILKNILKFITFIGAVVAAVFLLRAFVIEPFVVPTGSMESTIEVGDCILAQKITLEAGSDLKPGDIVVFKNPRPRNGVDILPFKDSLELQTLNPELKRPPQSFCYVQSELDLPMKG